MPDDLPFATDSPEDQPDEEAWDAPRVMRDRATASRTTRDLTIADLREEMNDDQIRDEFGIDLGEIER